MKACNPRNGMALSTDVETADSLFKRMKGLIGRKELAQGAALWIKPCKGIHTIGMKCPIDVAFLDKRNIVVKIKKNFRPNRMTGLYLNAVSVLELPEGTLTATDTRIGDRVEFAGST